MQKTLVLGLILGFWVNGLNAQILKQNYLHRNLRIHTDTCIIDMQIIEDDITIKAKPELTYYWYKNRQIFTNQGGIGGNVLDGSYKCFSKTDHLLEEGLFEKGLKVGVWKEWSMNGKLTQVQQFKQGQLQGKSLKYETNNEIFTTKYRHGEPINKKVPFFIWWKNENKTDTLLVGNQKNTQPEVLLEENSEKEVVIEPETSEMKPDDGKEIMETNPTDTKRENKTKSKRRRQENTEAKTEGKGE